MSHPRIALVCDWLTTPGGAEKVLLELHRMYPEAPIYTSQYSKKGIDWFNDADVRTGWLQIFPRSLRKILGVLRYFYFSHLDLSDYDIVISVTGAEAKAVRTKKGCLHSSVSEGGAEATTEHAVRSARNDGTERHVPSETEECRHICYCHVPTQYYWQYYDQYMKDPGFGWLNWFVRLGFKIFVKPMRKADFKVSQQPDQFVTISQYAASEIKKYYKREAIVVNPPVDVAKFSTLVSTVLSTENCKKSTESKKISTKNPQEDAKKSTENDTNSTKSTDISTSFPQVFHRKGQKLLSNFDYYVISCRQVTWKRVDLAIKSCLKTQNHLVVIGDGSEHQNLIRLAKGSNLITFIPWLAASDLAIFLQHAKAYIFPSLEPFGIAPVEALAAGCPVIAYAKGGSMDFMEPGVNGLTFQRQEVGSLVKALQDFQEQKFNARKVAATAQRFSTQNFRQAMQKLILRKGNHEISH